MALVQESPVRSGPGAARIALGVVLLVAVLAAVWFGLGAYGELVTPYLQSFTDWVDGLGVWGPLVFIAGYALATVAFAPGSVLTLSAGPIFGVAAGALYALTGATIGACCAFLVARYAARDAIARRVAGDARFAAIDRAVAVDGRKIVFLLRLSPVFPFNLLNYALGLTRVRFVDFAVASIGMLPGTLLYVYIGAVGAAAASAASGTAGETSLLKTLFWVFGFAVTALVTVLVTRTARRALADATAS